MTTPQAYLKLAPGPNSYIQGTATNDFVMTTNLPTQNVFVGPSNALKPFIITSSNVGIGTNTPNFILDVNGALNATSISRNGKLTASWLANSDGDMYVMESNVGINTSNPMYPLDVIGTIRTASNIIVWDNAGTNTNQIQLGDAKHSIYSTGTNGNSMFFNEVGGTFYFTDSTSSTVLYAMSNASLGVNQATPAYTLDVNGTARIGNAGNATSILIGSSTDSNAGLFISALDDTLTPGDIRGITFGKQNTANNQGEITYNHISNGNGSNNVQIGLMGNHPLTVQASGFVGVGTTTPVTRLDVRGQTNITDGRLQVLNDSTASNAQATFYNSNLVNANTNIFVGEQTSNLTASYFGHWNMSDTSKSNYARVGVLGSPSELIVDARGYIGIGKPNNGTAVLKYPLDVMGDVAIQGTQYMTGPIVIKSADYTYSNVFYTSTTDGSLNFVGSNVGINKTPDFPLDVTGTIRTTSNVIVRSAIGIGTDSNPTTALYVNAHTGDRLHGVYVTSVQAGLVLDSTQTPNARSYNIWSTADGEAAGLGSLVIYDNTPVTGGYRIVVNSNAFVGINTATPNTYFHVVGDALVDNIALSNMNAGSATFRNATQGPARSNAALLQDASGNTTLNAAFGSTLYLASGGLNQVQLSTSNFTPLLDNTVTQGAPAKRFVSVYGYHMYAASNVGIGIDTPAEALQVNGGNALISGKMGVGVAEINANYTLDVQNAVSTSDAKITRLYAPNIPANAYAGLRLGTSDTANNDWSIAHYNLTTAASNYLAFTANSQTTPALAIQAGNGYVGIGTTTPISPLNVYIPSSTTNIPQATINNGAAYVAVNANATSASKNGLVNASDASLIFTNGIQNKGNMVIGPWTSSPFGIRIVGSNGYVGMGLSNPWTNLDVAGSLALSNNVGSTSNSKLYFATQDPNHYIFSTGTNGNNMVFGEFGANFHFYDTQQNKDIVTITNGRLGVGVTSPAFAVDVSGVGNFRNGTMVTTVSTTIASNLIQSYDSAITNTDARFIEFGKTSSANNSGCVSYNHVLDGSASNYIGLGVTGQKNVLAVTGNAFVGVGTVTPSVKLDVKGTIHGGSTYIVSRTFGNASTLWLPLFSTQGGGTYKAVSKVCLTIGSSSTNTVTDLSSFIYANDTSFTYNSFIMGNSPNSNVLDLVVFKDVQNNYNFYAYTNNNQVQVSGTMTIVSGTYKADAEVVTTTPPGTQVGSLFHNALMLGSGGTFT